MNVMNYDPETLLDSIPICCPRCPEPPRRRKEEARLRGRRTVRWRDTAKAATRATRAISAPIMGQSIPTRATCQESPKNGG